ncbi:hypothetical protein E4U53_002127 [Claviceps sorghi]|nr:hypothetical protein E4U53_002127 [Claviceps sorghi]
MLPIYGAQWNALQRPALNRDPIRVAFLSPDRALAACAEKVPCVYKYPNCIPREVNTRIPQTPESLKSLM